MGADDDPRSPGAPPEPDPSAQHARDDEDEDRAAILARRRALVRRSIATVGVLVGGLASADCSPTPCLDIAPPMDAATDAPPADAPPADAAPDASGD